MSDWSAWQAYFTPIVPPSASGPGSPAGRPIPTKSPSFAELQAWVNMIPSLPEPAMMAHAEEVARGVDHSTIVGHGPAKSGPSASNLQLRQQENNNLTTKRQISPLISGSHGKSPRYKLVVS